MTLSEHPGFQHEGNNASINHYSERIITLDQLLKLYQVDLGVWEVVEFQANKWEGYRANKESDLTFEEGVMTGRVRDHGGLLIEPLFQIKARLRKRSPEPIRPVIRPVVIDPSGSKTATFSDEDRVYRALAIFDPHFGFLRKSSGDLISFHDNDALDVILQVVDLEPFDIVILGGDSLDLAEWTDKFIRTPEFHMTTQLAVIAGAQFISELKKRVERVVVLEGNHCQRIEKMLLTHFWHAFELKPADQLEGPALLSVPNLLGLDRMGVEYIGQYPDNRFYLLPSLSFEHGNVVGAKPGSTAGKIVDNSTISRGFGHIHRRELATRKVPQQKYSISAFCPGCLCRVDGIVPGSSAESNWQQGFAVIEYLVDGPFNVLMFAIEGGETLYKNQVIRSRLSS